MKKYRWNKKSFLRRNKQRDLIGKKHKKSLDYNK